MRRSQVFIPEASEADEFGQHAVAFMRRVLKLGYEAALAEELAKPTWDDPDWCAMIVARASGQIPKLRDDDRITFRCHKCKDTGFVDRDDMKRHGSVYRVSAPCDPCSYRLWAKARWLKDQERDSPRRGSRLREDVGDD